MDHWFKVNVDGATFAQSQTVGVGVLICDFASRVEAALSKRLFLFFWVHLKLKLKPWRRVLCLDGMWVFGMWLWRVILKLSFLHYWGLVNHWSVLPPSLRAFTKNYKILDKYNFLM